MAWVRSEYAGEFAVVSAWLCALMPWSVTVLRPADARFSFVILRYAYFHFQFLMNLSLPGERTFLWLDEVYRFVGPNVQPAIVAAAAGALIFTAALVLSVAYYLAEDRVESGLPVDPVRLMGALLGLAALAYAASYVLLIRSKSGVSVPLGLLFMAGFAIVLLRVDRT